MPEALQPEEGRRTKAKIRDTAQLQRISILMLLYRAAFTFSIVIFKAKVRDELLTFQITQSVLELH